MSIQVDSTDISLSSVERVKASLARAKEVESLGSLIHIDNEGALKTAQNADDSKQKGALHGVPIVVKDNIHVAGMPNSAGTPALKNFTPTKNNAVVEALTNAGAIVIAKANMHELAFGITSNNVGFGAVHNAHNSDMIAGGSSGGTAVAVAAGIVAMGLGTDTGGSTRIPAALNGIVGLRPTIGRYNSDDVTPVASTRDTVGPMAATVAHIALMDSVITGEAHVSTPAELKGLRLGVPREYFYAGLSSEVSQNIESVLAKLGEAGVELVDIDMPGLQEANDGVSFPVALYECINELPEYLKNSNTGVSWEQLLAGVASPDVRGALESQLGDEAIPESVYQQAIKEFRPQLQAIYKDAINNANVDALIFPTTPLVASPIASSDETVELNGEQAPTFPTYIHNTDPSSNAGLPSLTLPSGKTSSGLPMGVMLDGLEGSDRRLIEIGLAIESVL